MSNPAEMYACIYAREFPAQALLRFRSELKVSPFAVLQGEPPSQQVISCNAKAHSLGVSHGMSRVEMDTFPSVAIMPRSLSEEAAAKAALLECLGAFSPSIENLSRDRDFLGVLDIAGTEKLLGTPQALARTLLEQTKALGVVTCVAIASNFHTSVCLARGASTTGRINVTPNGREHDALAPLPLTVLDLPEDAADTFSTWGIRTLGMLAALPEKELIARMGQKGRRFRQLACGTLSHLFVPIEPAFALEEFMELDSPVELLESLLFVVSTMLEQLISRAAERVLALASVTVHLSLEGGVGKSHMHTVRPALPTNDRQLWIKLLHLDLQAHPPPAAILAVRLNAEPGKTGKVQLGLFSPQLPEPTRLDLTLARIRAIVGDEHVGSPALKDTHGLDSFQMKPFVIAPATATTITRQSSLSAMRWLRPAEPVWTTLVNHRLKSFLFRAKRYEVETVYGPWSAEGDWWSPTHWSVQQWDVVARSDAGLILCCCVIFDLAEDIWRMVALYD